MTLMFENYIIQGTVDEIIEFICKNEQHVIIEPTKEYWEKLFETKEEK